MRKMREWLTQLDWTQWDQAAGGSATAELPTRNEVAPEHKWKLEDMYATNQAWEEDAQALRQLLQQLAQFHGRLGESAAVTLQLFQLRDELGQKLDRLYSYARMRRDEDNASTTYQALTDRATTLAIEASGALAFIEPELLSLPEEQLRSYMTSPGLSLYRFVFEELLRQKPHVLSTTEEQLLAQVGEMASAPSQIFTMFNNADMRFPTVKDDDGNDVELTHGRYIQFLESRKRDVRKGAFDAMYSTFNKHRNTLAAIYGASVKKDVFYSRVRKYESARQQALEADNVPLSVYDNLIDAVHKALPALHKYLELRKRALGLSDLHMYDLYTSIVPDFDMKVPYTEAVDTVIKAVAPLGEEYVKVAAEGLSAGGWVDVFETRGKTSGAYSSGAFGVHPYILLNYQDTLDNMFTLAHELGHAMHTYYSHRTQPYVYADYTIFVAEVASTCNEALLMDYLLKHTDDKRMRAYLINHHLETIRGTVYRQTMFAEFEKLTHAHVEAGDALTPEWLCEQYYSLNQQFFAAEVDVDKDIEMEWGRIPHFYRAFYVYKYATGLSAATALSQKILTEGQPAVDAYLNFLKSGGSDFPIELLRKAGVDMDSPQPVEATLKLFSELVDELAALLD